MKRSLNERFSDKLKAWFMLFAVVYGILPLGGTLVTSERTLAETQTIVVNPTNCVWDAH